MFKNIESEYERQNNLAVDMCAACIAFARAKHRPLRSIHLHPAYFEMFRKWVHDKIGEEAAETKSWQMDGVNIELGSRFQLNPLFQTFWEADLAKA